MRLRTYGDTFSFRARLRAHRDLFFSPSCAPTTTWNNNVRLLRCAFCLLVLSSARYFLPLVLNLLSCLLAALLCLRPRLLRLCTVHCALYLMQAVRRLLPRLLRLSLCLLSAGDALCLVPYTLRLAQDVQASAPATRNCCACALHLVPAAGALCLRACVPVPASGASVRCALCLCPVPASARCTSPSTLTIVRALIRADDF